MAVYLDSSANAIHIATAQRLGSDLKAMVSYDDRMIATATQLGHRVVSPK